MINLLLYINLCIYFVYKFFLFIYLYVYIKLDYCKCFDIYLDLGVIGFCWEKRFRGIVNFFYKYVYIILYLIEICIRYCDNENIESFVNIFFRSRFMV